MEPADFLCLWDYKVFTVEDIEALNDEGQLEERLIQLGLNGWNGIGVVSGCLFFKRPIVRSEDLKETDENQPESMHDDCRGCVKFNYKETDETGRQHGFCKHHNWNTSHNCDFYIK